MKRNEFAKFLGKTFDGFQEEFIPEGLPFYKGKVRDVFDIGEYLVITTTDRISAFDRVLSTIPCKGEILNQMALFWFKKTEDIIENHIVKELTSRSVLVKKAQVLPVEVIVRGYLTGSAWRDYKAGNPVSGIKLPTGMKMDQKFSTPLITPSTKAEQGSHDMPISREEIVKQGLVPAQLWSQVEQAALALFARGTEIAAKNGLILVDTKYEFGIYNDKLIVVDEIHTPDSSRFWYANTYNELYEKGEEQRKVDKEFLRKWLMDRGFMGEGESPFMDEQIRLDVAEKYRDAYQLITGKKFKAKSLSAEKEINKVFKAIIKYYSCSCDCGCEDDGCGCGCEDDDCNCSNEEDCCCEDSHDHECNCNK